jgi:hypothetical protein
MGEQVAASFRVPCAAMEDRLALRPLCSHCEEELRVADQDEPTHFNPIHSWTVMLQASLNKPLVEGERRSFLQ